MQNATLSLRSACLRWTRRLLAGVGNEPDLPNWLRPRYAGALTCAKNCLRPMDEREDELSFDRLPILGWRIRAAETPVRDLDLDGLRPFRHELGN